MRRLPQCIEVPLIPRPRKGWTPAETKIIAFARDHFFKNHCAAPLTKEIASHTGNTYETTRHHLKSIRAKQPMFTRVHQLPFLET